MRNIYEFKKNNLEFESWKKWYLSFVIEKPRAYKGAKKQKQIIFDDDIAVEVLRYRKELTKFAGIFYLILT